MPDTWLKNTLRALQCGGLAVVVAPLACDEQHADAVLYVGPDSGVSVFEDDGSAGAGFDDDDSSERDDTLCRSCEEHSDCGSRNLCLKMSPKEYRCGRDCDGDFDCPPGYDCLRIEGTDDERQCVPDDVSCSQLVSPELDELRSFIIDLVNDIRRDRGLHELRLDEDCLNAIAQEAVEDYQITGREGTKLYWECASRIPNCECNWQDESQARVRLGSHGWQDSLEDYFEAASADPNGPFFDNVVSSNWERIGIGGLVEETYMLISLDFAP